MKRLLLAAIAVAAAGTTAMAETATLELGNYATTDEVLEGSVAERGMPVNYMYHYSGGQLIYPNALVKDIADKNGEITSLTFRYRDSGTFYDGDIEGTSKIWAQATDLQSIPLNDSNKGIWTAYSGGSQATISIDYTLTYSETEYEITYTFATPVKLAPGQSLLVTASTEVTNGMEPNMYDFECFGFSAGTEKYVSFYGSDTQSFEDDYAAGNVNQWTSPFAPVVKIAYNYVDKLPQLDAPVFSPESGSVITTNDKITITAAEGASIFYTLEENGTPDTPYTEPFSITDDATITAIAKAEGYEDSAVATASYTIKVVDAPVFSPESGTALGPDDKVTITAAEGATILYTLAENGTPDITYEAPIALDKAATITAVAKMSGCKDSETVSASYTVKVADAPTFSPASGTALGPDDKVTITAAEGATILYTLEKGATPDITYEAPIALDKAATITAVAKMEGFRDSETVSASYTVKVTAAPKFAIPDGTLLGSNEKVIIKAPEGAKVLYTLSADAEPDQEYPEEGITLTADATVKAVAVAEGYFASKSVEANYTVSEMKALIIGGYYDDPDANNTFDGTNWYNAPIIPTYANSASQLLYIPSELADFYEKNTLHSVSFRFTNETSFSTYESYIKFYVQETDATAFDYDNLNSKYKWFETPLNAPDSDMDYEINYADYYYMCGELVFQLPENGVSFEKGKSLLLTVVNEAATPLDNSEYPQFLKYNTTDHRAAIFASDKCKYDASLKESPYISNGSNYYSMMTDKNQPCVKIFYSENTEDGVKAIGSDSLESDGTVEYYDLTGVRVSGKPAPGIYVVRRGAKVTKEIVR